MRFLGPSEAEKHTQRTQSTKKGSAGLSRDLIEVMPLVTVSLQLSPASPACLQGQQLSAPPAARFPAADSVRWGGRGYWCPPYSFGYGSDPCCLIWGVSRSEWWMYTENPKKAFLGNPLETCVGRAGGEDMSMTVSDLCRAGVTAAICRSPGTPLRSQSLGGDPGWAHPFHLDCDAGATQNRRPQELSELLPHSEASS